MVGNTVGLRDAVVWMHEHPEERRTMAARGRAMCAQMFSTEAMVQGLEAVYARAIELAESR
jgi:glycosyltransferase involved in cell wall biosynthesis